MPDPATDFDGLGKKFATAAEGWGTLAQRSAVAQGNEAAARVIGALTRMFSKLVAKLTALLKKAFETFNPFGGDDPIQAFLDAAIDDMLDTATEILDGLADAAAATLDAAVAAVTGIFEAIKKAIHLVLDRVKVPAVTGPIETVLDLINNVIGNIAELVSAAAGKLAGTFRTNMYVQLAEIRAANAARPPLSRSEEPGEDPPRTRR